MKKFFAFSLVALALTAHADDTWYPTYMGALDDGENIKLNWQSVAAQPFTRSQGSYVSADVKRDYYTNRKTAKGISYRSERTHWYADCQGARYIISTISWHDKSGKIVAAAAQPVAISGSENWGKTADNEAAAEVFDWICWAAEVKADEAAITASSTPLAN